MRILLVSTLKRRVSADETASRSQIIYRLGKGLAEKGHKVSLLGTGDSKIPGVKTITAQNKGWVDLPPVENEFFRDVSTLVGLAKKTEDVQKSFDIIHNHASPEFFLPLIENELKIPLLTTIHSQATNYTDETLSNFKSYFVALSKIHQKSFKKTKIPYVVYNGIDTNKFSFQPKKQDLVRQNASSAYLLWLGRLSKAKNKDGSFMDPKGLGWAIRLAKETGEKLFISGAVEDRNFFEKLVKPNLSKRIQWVGEVSDKQPLSQSQIIKLMQGAKGFLMTVNWNEPFGLAMAEAGSVGTPVIGFNKGSVPEIVINGKTGWVVPYEKGLGGLEEALSKLPQIDPKACRENILQNFSTEKMVSSYENLYKKIVQST